MLHITDGESVAGTLRESAIPDDVSIYGDLMYEGPAPGGLDAEAWRIARARFLAEGGYATPDEARQHLKAFDDTLAASFQHEEVVIWLDHRLSDHLILIKVLDWFSRQNPGDARVSLICIGRYPGMDRFAGLGELRADQLASLAGTRMVVGDAQFGTARAAWNAFTSPDPTAIEHLIETDTAALPFLAAALRRHLEQFPSVDGGLSRSERQALSVLSDRGSLSGRQLFAAVQNLEEQIFMGDLSFYRILTGLASVRWPLVQISDASRPGRAEVRITEAGRDILEGRADHIERNGIDRWLGGVHLQGGHAAWRWDRAASRLVAQT